MHGRKYRQLGREKAGEEFGGEVGGGGGADHMAAVATGVGSVVAHGVKATGDGARFEKSTAYCRLRGSILGGGGHGSGTDGFVFLEVRLKLVVG